jgi:hypothetical protein
MSTAQPTLETWEMKARRLATDLAALKTARHEAHPSSHQWTKLTKLIVEKRYEIDAHLARVDGC